MKTVFSWFLVLAIALFAVIPSLSAATPTPGNDGLIPNVKGELSVLVVMRQLNASNPDGGGVYEYFKKYYPNLKLKQEDLIHESYTAAALPKAIAAGHTPDVFITTPGDIPDLISKKYIYPLDTLLAANPGYVKTLNPSALKMNKVSNHTYGVTWMTLPQAWLINTDLFENMGVTVPTDNWTIDDFIAVNKEMVDKANGITGSQPNIGDSMVLFSFLEAYGVKGFKMVRGKPVSNFAQDPKAIKAIEKFLEYAAKSNIALTDEELTKFGLKDPWSAIWGKQAVGMVPWSLWGQPFNPDTKQLQFNWTVVRQPKGPAGRAAMSVGLTLSVFPTSQKKDLAMKYIKILTSKHFYENARLLNVQTGVNNPLTIKSNEVKFPLGIPAINVKFKSTPENQSALDGFVRSMQDAKTPNYGGFGSIALKELAARMGNVASGAVQIPDMLKELDQVVNTNYYNKK